jgi:hypothetical protein
MAPQPPALPEALFIGHAFMIVAYPAECGIDDRHFRRYHYSGDYWR